MEKNDVDSLASKTRRDSGRTRVLGTERAEMHGSRSSRPPEFKGRVSREALAPLLTLASAGVLYFEKSIILSHILVQPSLKFVLRKQKH